MDYKMNIACKTKIYHANLLKLYLDKQETEQVPTVGIAIIEKEDHLDEGAVNDRQLLDITK